MTTFRRVAIVLLVVGLVLILSKVSANGAQLKNQHQLELRLGVWNHSPHNGLEIDYGGNGSRLEANGMTGSLGYAYFLSEAWAMQVSIGVRSAGAEIRYDRTQASLDAGSVVHILVGSKYYLPGSEFSSVLRPYLSTAIGSYIASDSWTGIGYNTVWRARTETTVGARLGAGLDLRTSARIMTGVLLAYNLMADFDHPVGGSKNYNGAEFSVGFSYLFGRSAETK